MRYSAIDSETGTSYSQEFQTDPKFAHGWKSVLAKAHRGTAKLRCGCFGRGEKRLAVRYHDESDTYWLARYPLTGEEHSNDCRYYAPNPEKSGMSGYEAGVVTEGDNGRLKIRLEIGLTQKAPKKGDNTPDAPRHGSPRRSQAAMKLLGLLHFLWEEAELNVWWPAMENKRNKAVINDRLVKAASNITAGGVRLEDVLLLSATPEGFWARRNASRVADAVKTGRRMILVAPLAKCRPDIAGEALAVNGFSGIPILGMYKDLWKRAATRFERAMTAWKSGQPTMVIAVVELRNNPRYAKVADLALMSITENGIPVESSFERVIAEKLTAEKRAFMKPLRFDADQDAVFPDFILRDTNKDVPLEVFGRTDEDYEARKAEKIAYYDRNFGTAHWWYWNAAADPDGLDIQPFPPATGS